MKVNLLFTSVGRRRYMVEYFQASLRQGENIAIANSDPVCASFSLPGVEKIVSPPIYHADYIPFLIDRCQVRGINALISLFDADLPVLAENKERFESAGVRVLVAEPSVIALCNDKWKTISFLRREGLRAPKTWLNPAEALQALRAGEVAFPMIVKPRWGMGSIGLRKVDSAEGVEAAFHEIRDEVFQTYLRFESGAEPEACVLIQECLAGQEYGLDVINDLYGNPIMTSVKRKLAMRSGETDAAVTEDVPALRELGGTLGEKLRHPGNLDADVFWDGKQATLLEMNARFGGGYPFSHLAGVDLPRAILSWLRGEEAAHDCFTWKEGIGGIKTIVPVPIALEEGK